ncbi:MAG: pyridoxal-dependent decarboxylase, exosortase A system-associated [Hyphomicrobiales bacterium]|nr:pyridoxal-dependent decarboxylase, exosortase A system-associated [Hyphomicrobiales bacterium]
MSGERHPALDGWQTDGGELLVGGVPLSRLAARVGQTPFFAYDRARLTARVDELRRVLPAGLHLHYAVKANPMAAVVQHLAGLVDGFDVASAGEMTTALDTPMAADRISFAGPGKTDAELEQAIAAGIVLHLESEGEMARAAAIAEVQGRRPRVAIRVNPDFELKASGMKMGGGPQQFGVDAERVPQMLGELAKMDLDFAGFHLFAGSQNLRADILMDTQAKIVDLAIALAAHAPAPVTHLNIGGGFGIPYFPKDQRLDLGPVGDHLAELAARVAGELPEATLITELGRYIVGEAGVYVTRVVDRKESRGQVFLVCDGGLNHHLAASGNFGQVIRRNYPVAVGTRMDGAVETASVVGCLCTPLDLLADRAELPRADVGDLVVIFQSGAYGPSASPAAFLGHPPAAEVLV